MINLLLQNGQEEREALMLKQEELLSEISELRRTSDCCIEENTRLTERVRVLESSIDATHVERKQLDLELARAKEESSSRQIEISRLSTLLENARAKVVTLIPLFCVLRTYSKFYIDICFSAQITVYFICRGSVGSITDIQHHQDSDEVRWTFTTNQ